MTLLQSGVTDAPCLDFIHLGAVDHSPVPLSHGSYNFFW